MNDYGICLKCIIYVYTKQTGINKFSSTSKKKNTYKIDWVIGKEKLRGEYWIDGWIDGYTRDRDNEVIGIKVRINET